MVLYEEQECGVCYERYTRSERIPRKLYCNHTFCALCLDAIAQEKSGMLCVRCPMCRQVSCVRRGLSLQEALWIDSHLWDRIPAELENKEEEEEERSTTAQATPDAQDNCGSRPTSKHYRCRLGLRSILAKVFHKQTHERIVPVCNVQMNAWRRLSAEEII